MTGVFHRNSGNSVEMDEVAVRRLVTAYQCDERPSMAILAKRFGRSTDTLRSILREKGVLREPVTMQERLADPMYSADFLRIVSAAVAGERCPMNEALAAPIQRLTRAGLIRVEVFNRNFRLAIVLAGPHAGKQTQAPPLLAGKAQHPYLVSDATGTYRNGIALLNGGAKSFRNGAPVTLRRSEERTDG